MTRSDKRWRSKVAAIAFAAACLLQAPAVLAIDPTTQIPLAKPKLEIVIPDVTLTGAVTENGYITIPFVAQYVAGVYKFLASIVGVVAAVAIMLGGFQYLTAGGDKGKVDAAKKRIRDALLGMAIVLGSYTMLFVINPDLVNFKSFQLLALNTEYADEDIKALMDTTASTSNPPTAVTQSSGTQAAADAPFSGTIYKTCPLTLTDTSMKGIPDFMNQIRASMGTIIDAKTPMDKVVQIGNIAAKCDMHLGNCGKSVGTFYALAGVLNEATCNKNSTNNKDCNAWPDIKVHSVPDSKFVWWARCDNEQALSIKDEPACAKPGPWQRIPGGKVACKDDCMCTRSDCVTGQFPATEKVGKDLLEYAKNQPEMAGWPDSWVKDLKRGDWVIMYNGNDDKTGGHSAMFVGWQDKDTMITLNGDAKHGVHYSSQCITSACQKKPQGWGMWNPVTRILRQRTN